MATPEATNINGYYFKDEAGRNLISQEAATRQTQFNTMNNQLQTLIASGLVPYAVDSTSQMVNQNRIYVLKSTGKWYYYNTDTSTWTIGGDYQAVNTDSTLETVTSAYKFKQVTMSDISWHKGGVQTGNHSVTSNQNDRIRTTTVMKVKAGSIIKFTGVDAGYQFKASLYSEFTYYNTSFISEPVAYADNATELTIPVDCYIIISIKQANGNDIDDEDLPTIEGYINTSELYLTDEDEVYGDNITDKLVYFDNSDYRQSGKYIYTDANMSTTKPIPIKSGDIVGILKTASSDNSIYVTILDKNGDSLYYDATTQVANGMVAPADSAYVIFKMATADKSNIVIKTMKKPVNYQSTLGILTKGTKVKLIAHRGLEKFAPEATIPAYTIAGQKGMWANKLDICETADGKFVMSHDTTVDRMFNGTGSIADMTLAQLQELTVDAGNNIDLYPNEKIVTLEQALTICKKYNMYALIEMKNILSTASIPNILKVIEDAGMIENTLCQCSGGNRLWLNILRVNNPNIPILYWNGDASNNLSATIRHCPIPLFNSVYMLSSWNNDYNEPGYLDYIKSTWGMPLCTAVIDGNNALTKANTAITNGAIYMVTDQITPADIAPVTYTA